MHIIENKLSRTAILLLSCFVFFAFVEYGLAKVGVGMGAGEIRVTEDIKPGGIYTLPSLRVFNTGDEVTTYSMNVAYHQDNPEFRPQKDWFNFSPMSFEVAPGQSQEVAVVMTVPIKTVPGEYFAFVESGPVATDKPGTSVGVAVATKLYFTIVPANLFAGIMYRMSSFFAAYSPWSWILLAFASIVLLGLVFKRFFSLNISLQRNSKDE